MTIGDDGSDPAACQLAQLEVRQERRDFVTGEEPVVALPVSARHASPPMRSASGSVEMTRSAPCSRATRSALSMHSGTSGFGVFVTFGNCPSGVACSGTGMRSEALGLQHLPGAEPAAPVERRENDADLVESSAAEEDSACGRVRCRRGAERHRGNEPCPNGRPRRTRPGEST